MITELVSNREIIKRIQVYYSEKMYQRVKYCQSPTSTKKEVGVTRQLVYNPTTPTTLCIVLYFRQKATTTRFSNSIILLY